MSILRAGLMALLLPGPSPAWGGDLSGVRGFPRDLLRGFREELRPEGLLTLLAAGAGAGIARYGKTTTIDDFHVAGWFSPGHCGSWASHAAAAWP